MQTQFLNTDDLIQRLTEWGERVYPGDDFVNRPKEYTARDMDMMMYRTIRDCIYLVKKIAKEA